MTLYPINGYLKVSSPPIYPTIVLSFSPSIGVLSEVQAEGTKVARGIVRVDHGRGGHGDEELVAGPQLEQSSLVNGVEGIFGVWSPALCSHSLQQLYGAWVGSFLVDALHQLVADAALVSIIGGRGRITKINL